MMDYDSVPTEVRNSLDDPDIYLWLKAYNDALATGDWTPEYAKQIAWKACRFADSSRYVCAIVSTEIVDDEGDLAMVKEYVVAGQELVARGGILTKNHSNKIIGTVWCVEEGTEPNTKKPCVVAYMNFFRGTMLYDTAWNEFKAGRTEFSIGSFIKKPQRHCDFKGCYNVLIPEQWFELSNVDRGINPVTYPLEVNEEAKGYEVPKGTIIEMHEDICPVKAKYLRFKAHMHDAYGLDTNYGDDFILIHGGLNDDSLGYVLSEYPEIRGFEYEGEDQSIYTLILPEITVNEVDAGTEAPAIAESDAVDEKVKGPCPAGQHEHAGIRGCHDILRRHHSDYRTSPTDTLDLTDDNIDISAIQNTPSDRLRNIVTKIASVLSHYSDDAVQQFLSSVQGKEFILAFLELKRRKLNGEKTMAEKEAGCSASVKAEVENAEEEPVAVVEETKSIDVESTTETTTVEDASSEAPTDEAEKGTIPDVQSSIANISSTLASITALIDQMNIRLMKLEDSDIKSESDSGQNISDAILSATQGDVDGAPAIPDADSVASDGDKGEVPPQFEKNDDESSDEESKDDESKDESKEESDDDKSSDEAPANDESKDDESKDKDEEKKPEENDEESKESKDESDEKKDEDEKDSKKKEEDEEKKKGTEEEAPASEEVPASPAPSDAGAESAEKADIAPVAEPEPAAPAPVEPVKDDFEVPIPSGGQAVDFRAMLLKRQIELAQKGVQLYIAESGTQNSLANVPIETIKGTNVTLVRPSSAVKAFDPETGVGGSFYDKGLWSKMGTMDSQTFLRKLIGE